MPAPASCVATARPWPAAARPGRAGRGHGGLGRRHGRRLGEGLGHGQHDEDGDRADDPVDRGAGHEQGQAAERDPHVAEPVGQPAEPGREEDERDGEEEEREADDHVVAAEVGQVAVPQRVEQPDRAGTGRARGASPRPPAGGAGG